MAFRVLGTLAVLAALWAIARQYLTDRDDFHDERSNGQKKSERPAEDREPTQEGNTTSIPLIDSAKVSHHSNDNKWKADEYKAARKQLAAAKVLNVITAIAAAVGAIGLFFIYLSFEDARTATELSQRPWVSIDPIQLTDLIFDRNGAHVSVAFTLKNSGHSPAAHTFLEAELFPLQGENFVFSALDRQQHICGPLRARADNDRAEFATFTLFPDVAIPKSIGLSVGMDQINQAERHDGGKPFLMELLILGCVDYRFEFEKGHHQTGFMYSLARSGDPKHPDVPYVMYPQDGGILPASLLILTPWPFGNAFYAD
jgi:hypothetical protein